MAQIITSFYKVGLHVNVNNLDHMHYYCELVWIQVDECFNGDNRRGQISALSFLNLYKSF